MKLKLLFTFLFFSILNLQAQDQFSSGNQAGSINGKVIDKNSKQPIPYVNISLKENNKIITGGITQDNGSFSIKNLELKNYVVEFLFIGYKTQTKNISLSASNKSINMGTIELVEEAIQLKGVEIVNEKSTIEQKIDRKVINVGKDLISVGLTAGEIMNNIPSVSVDPQTNAISLRGNSNVRILVDGKPTNIDPSRLLQQIPSASIKQIELITNPSAKYNPEGMSGIINIILNKNTAMGFNGRVNSGVTFGITPKLNSSLDMNYRTGKFNFFGNYGLNTGINANNGFIKSFETGRENTQKFDFDNENTSNLIKTGFDFYINDNNTFSFFTNQNTSRINGTAITFIDFVNNSSNDILQRVSNKNENNTQSYNADYKLKFKKEGHNLEFEANYNKNDNPERSLFQFPFTSNSFSNQIDKIGENSIFNIDYVNPLTKTTKLEIGIEGRNDKTTNLFDIDNNYNSDFKYKRSIYSTYVTLGKQWKKFSLQAGSRLEKYNVDALFRKSGENDSTFEDEIITVYPSAFFSYIPSDKNTFNFNYSRRVDRPSIGQINPIREWTTPTFDSRGNPNLVPQFTNSFEVNYTRKTKLGSITSGVFYRQINDEITRVVFNHPTDPNKSILSYDNFDNNNAYGVEVSSNLDFQKWWSANISLDAYNKKVKGTVETTQSNFEFIEVDATIFNARINNNFKVNKDLRFQLFGMYRGQDRGLQFTRKPMWKVDFGSSYNVLKGNGTISARYSDIFRAMNFSFEGDRPYRSEGEFNWESRTFNISFNYRFGSGKNRALQRKQRDKNETQGSGGMI